PAPLGRVDRGPRGRGRGDRVPRHLCRGRLRIAAAQRDRLRRLGRPPLPRPSCARSRGDAPGGRDPGAGRRERRPRRGRALAAGRARRDSPGPSGAPAAPPPRPMHHPDFGITAFTVGELLLPWWAYPLVVLGIALLAVGSAAISLTGVVLSPLGVARDSRTIRMSVMRVVAWGLLILAFIGFS